MTSIVILRPIARVFALTLILAHTVLATRIPELPDWDDADTAVRGDLELK